VVGVKAVCKGRAPGAVSSEFTIKEPVVNEKAEADCEKEATERPATNAAPATLEVKLKTCFIRNPAV
jgi:hypothetical protein